MEETYREKEEKGVKGTYGKDGKELQKLLSATMEKKITQRRKDGEVRQDFTKDVTKTNK